MGKVAVLLVTFITLPTITFAGTCSSTGFSIVFVNGVLNELDKATANADELQKLVGRAFSSEPLEVRLGHNQSHLAGAGDLIQSIGQMFGSPVSNYDRDTILRQIHSEVSTRKILLVGHSQGTFYTNELYKYLTSHGVPAESIAVYNLATPANVVEGGGTYLTSANDQLVRKVREYAAAAGAPAPLDANILIPIAPSEVGTTFGGHSFSGAYLAGAPARIVADIEKALARLKASSAQNPDGCFEPPADTLSYKAQQIVFKAADPLAVAAKNGITHSNIAATSPFKNVAHVGHALGNYIQRTLVWVRPKDTQSAAAAALFIPEQAASAAPPTNTPVNVASAAGATPTPAPLAPEVVPPVLEPQPQQIQTQPVTPAPQQSNEYQPGFGGGGGSSSAPQSASSDSNTATDSTETIFSLDAPTITSPEAGSLHATTSITFEGTSAATLVLTATAGATSATTTADAGGSWSITIALPEGANTISFIASNDATSSAAVSRSVTVDTTPPDAPEVTSHAATSTTSDPSVTINGTAEVGSTITLKGSTTAMTTANGGFWEFDVVLDEGVNELTFTSSDAAGNTSAETALEITYEVPFVEPEPTTVAASLNCTTTFSVSGTQFQEYESVEYVGGYIRYNFKLTPSRSLGVPFAMKWWYYDDECNTSSEEEDLSDVAIPAGSIDWSVRFTSPTHFDVWDDTLGTLVASVDYDEYPSYTHVKFMPRRSGTNFLSSSIRLIDQNGVVPSHTNTVTRDDACPSFASSDSSVLFDEYERAEYVNGLLRMHLRLSSPNNNGVVPFDGAVRSTGEECSVSTSADDLGEIEYTPHMRYYSFRMTSATRWQLWNDEKNEALTCSDCSGDIPAGSAYVYFYAKTSSTSWIRTTPFAPTN